MSEDTGNFRSAVLNEPRLASSAPIMKTPFGNVRSTVSSRTTSGTRIMNAPPPPPPPLLGQRSYGTTMGGSGGLYSSQLYGTGMGMGGYGGFGSYGGYGGYGGFGGYGGYGTYNRFGNAYMNPDDSENLFIRMVEENSRPAFQSIESIVATVGNIASMLDSTFFAITSSFRAILGVAANFGRLRGVFAQFWQTFAIYRALIWIYKKLLYWLRLSKVDPSTAVFREAFSAAASQASGGNIPPKAPHMTGQSSWPVLVFLGFIFTAPYVIMKLIGNVANTARDEYRNPETWIEKHPVTILYDFVARNSLELTVRAGQTVLVAPKKIQNLCGQMKNGWALATVDQETSGFIPTSYIKEFEIIKHQKQQKEYQRQQEQHKQFKEQFELQQENQETSQLLSNSTETLEDEKNVEITQPQEILKESAPQSSPSPPKPISNANNSKSSNDSHSPSNLIKKNSNSSLPIIPEVDDSCEL